MATKTTSSRKEKKKKGEQFETEVILIVKGAGEQAEDDHLNIFLRGFWPAIKLLDRDASLEHKKLDERHQIAEVLAKRYNAGRLPSEHVAKRIWLKESYWEKEVLPSSALGNLSKEWRMASFVFANMFRNVIFSRNTRRLKKDRLEGFSKFQLWRTPGVRLSDYIGYYISYFLLFLVILLPFNTSLPTIGGVDGIPLVLIVGFIWAAAPAIEHSAGIYWYFEGRGGLKSLPGMPNWALLALIILSLSDPIAYIRLIATLITLQVTILVARALLWNLRTYANTDVDIAEYYSYYQNGDRTRKRIRKVDEFFLTRLSFTPFLYRYIILLMLPLSFIGKGIFSILNWITDLEIFGKGPRVVQKFIKPFENAFNIVLVGYLDDVVNYAMDPAQASRVRRVVMDDIIFFHNRPEVKRIHVVAHSQGTAITYESIFSFLDKKYQSKILTYATIGSVLSYYHQARGILDKVYYERFPVSEAVKQNFPEEFKWLNFWNFSDPITEFYGLDEYSNFEKAPPIDDEFYRTRTSPISVRTRTSLSKNHGEYWDNLEEFMLPLAKRVFGELRPPEWRPDVARIRETKDTIMLAWRHYRHHVAVLILWFFILTGGFFLTGWFVNSSIFNPLIEFLTTFKENAFAVYHHYNPPKEQDIPKELGMLWDQILTVALYFFGASIVTDWLSQIRRALRFNKNRNIYN